MSSCAVEEFFECWVAR